MLAVHILSKMNYIDIFYFNAFTYLSHVLIGLNGVILLFSLALCINNKYKRKLISFYFRLANEAIHISMDPVDFLSCWNILCWWTKWFREILQIHLFLNEMIKICCFVSIENFDKLQTKSYNGLFEFFPNLKKALLSKLT